MKASRMRPTPAMVVALIALIAGTAGVGYAATKISGSKLENASVAGKKLKKGTVKSKQIKDGGVKSKDLAPGVAGPPAAFSFHDRTAIAVGEISGSGPVTVGTLAGLSAGDYLLNGKAEVEPNPLGGSSTAQVVCALFVNGAEVDRSRLQIGENTATEPVTLRGTIPVLTVAPVPEGGTVTLGCEKGGAGIEVDASERSLTAVAVDLP